MTNDNEQCINCMHAGLTCFTTIICVFLLSHVVLFFYVMALYGHAMNYVYTDFLPVQMCFLLCFILSTC